MSLLLWLAVAHAQDADGDLVPDATELTGDSDGDGTPDVDDPDDDDDCVPTALEDGFYGGGPGANGDPTNDGCGGGGLPCYLFRDNDNDTLAGCDEDADGDGDPSLDDTDGDGWKNYADADDDNDGLTTIDELRATVTDPDGDSVPNHLDRDADDDGIPDGIDSWTGDADGDGTPDWLQFEPVAHSGGPHTGGPHTGGPHTGGPHTGGPHTGGPHTGGPPSDTGPIDGHTGAHPPTTTPTPGGSGDLDTPGGHTGGIHEQKARCGCDATPGGSVGWLVALAAIARRRR